MRLISGRSFSSGLNFVVDLSLTPAWVTEKNDLKAKGIEVETLIQNAEFYTADISTGYVKYNITGYQVNHLKYNDSVRTDNGITGNLVWMGRHMSVKPSLDEVNVGIKMVSYWFYVMVSLSIVANQERLLATSNDLVIASSAFWVTGYIATVSPMWMGFGVL